MWLEFWYVVSLFGSPYLWSGIAGALFIIFIVLRSARPESEKTKMLRESLFILIPALAVTFLLVVSLKAGLDVERICMPCPGPGCNPYCPLDASFPSGHTATIFTGFTSFYIMLGKRRFLALYMVPALVGLSRIALDVHTYPDVMVGALIGIIIPVLVYKVDKMVFREIGRQDN